MTQNHSVYEIQHAISTYMYILLSNTQLIHIHNNIQHTINTCTYCYVTYMLDFMNITRGPNRTNGGIALRKYEVVFKN